MTVAELIDILLSKPQDLIVAYRAFSEHNLLRSEQIKVMENRQYLNSQYGSDEDIVERSRVEGENKLPEKYLLLPGN